MDTNMKAFDEFWKLYNNNSSFKEIILQNMKKGKVRFFNDEEWDKINSQNFISNVPGMNEFIDMFILGYNIGNCGGASRQLSYSYDDVDIVSGILPFLKGSRNAEKEGGHIWLETPDRIIDTTLMLVIDKELKNSFGYIEEVRKTADDLRHSSIYQARKEFVNDRSLKKRM